MTGLRWRRLLSSGLACPGRRAPACALAPPERPPLLAAPADLHISKTLSLQGDTVFPHIVQLDGKIDGSLKSAEGAAGKGGIIVSETGIYLGDVADVYAVVCDGLIHGNVSAVAVKLGPHARVHGDIACQSLEVAAGAALQGEARIDAATELRLLTLDLKN